MAWTNETKHTTSWAGIPRLGSGVLQGVMTQRQDYYTQEQQEFGEASWTQETRHTASWANQTKH